MITSLDDYLVHQTAEPVNQPSQSDRNFYDRYWFNGFDEAGTFIFEAGFGLYPNRRVMDAHFSIVIGGRQYALHASRRAPRDRIEMQVGPVSITVLEPMRRIRVAVDDNETGIRAELVFSARTAAHQEPQNTLYEDTRLLMNTCRFTQFGRWAGWVSVDGRRVTVLSDACYGTRDKSWGVRPIGEPEGGAPGLVNKEPGVYWCWSPVHFRDFCTHYNTFQDRDGATTQLGAARLPVFEGSQTVPVAEEPGLVHIPQARHRIDWQSGTRWAKGAEIVFPEAGGERVLVLEPILRFQMCAIGYQHPEWGHGFWKGEHAIAREEYDLAALDPLDYRHIHVHQVCRARLGDDVGIGTLETVVFGRHDPSGFKSILDGAA